LLVEVLNELSVSLSLCLLVSHPTSQETQGVPVVTVGADEFPAFFTPHSGAPTPLRAESAAEVARMLCTSLSVCAVMGLANSELTHPL
jgi:pseudouridine-5'-phosphate glycosidase